MKPFTDHFSSLRKTISLLLIVAFVFSNVVAVQTFAATSIETCSEPPPAAPGGGPAINVLAGAEPDNATPA